jgi:hypothetical protein
LRRKDGGELEAKEKKRGAFGNGKAACPIAKYVL